MAAFLLACEALPAGFHDQDATGLIGIAGACWRAGHPAWRAVDRLANRIDPELPGRLRRSTRIYGRIYAVLGLRFAERYLTVARWVKSVMSRWRRFSVAH